MKTVKQLIDEYKNRQSNPKRLFITFEKSNRLAGYTNIVNLYRDGINVDIPKRDNKMHEYEFDYRFEADKTIRWAHTEFRGKIVEVSYELEA